MKKIFILLILFTLSMNYVNTSYATEVIDGDPDNSTPDYCNEPIDNTSNNDYSLCTDTSTDTSSTTETIEEEPEFCADDFVGPLSESEIIACTTYALAHDYVDYLSLADQTEYSRIEKIEGIWYGVIDVSDIYVQSAYVSIDYYLSSVGISFTRDTQDLKQIEIDYTTVQDSCTGVVAFNTWCIGSTADSYSDTLIINNTSNEDNWLSFLQGDYIHVGDEFDYMLLIDGPEIESVTVVKFTYVLTDLEVDDLRLDIQEQYEIEKQIIFDNPLLTDDQKLLQIVALMEEYLEYGIDYDEELTSICIGDQCTAYNENTTEDLPGIDPTNPFADMPDWVGSIAAQILKGVGIIIGAMAGVAFSGIIAYIMIRKALGVTGSAAIGTTKVTVTSSMWWGSMVGNGILVFLETIGNGIKSIWLTLVGKVIFIVLIILFIFALLF